MKIQWCEVTRTNLRAMPDKEIQRLYNDMCCDQGCEYTTDSCGNMVVIDPNQKRLIGNYYRGRGLTKNE